MTDVSHGTGAAVVFVVAFSIAFSLLLFVSIPVVWAIPATAGIVAITVKMVRDIQGNRAT